jgi:Mg/Co/Ni transporter MgtE
VFITACTNVITRQMAGERIHPDDVVSELVKELPVLLNGAALTIPGRSAA